MKKKIACKYAFSLYLALLVFFVPELSAQQLNSATAPGLTVINKSWRVTRLSPPADSDIPKADPQEDQVKILRNLQDNKERAKNGLPPERSPNPARHVFFPVSKKDFYIYEASMKNAGDKKIKSVTWEYVFYEPGTKRELGRQKFVSKVKIRPGEEKKISEMLPFPPTYIITAASVANAASDQYFEDVIIRTIEYANGSVWNIEDK